MGYAVRGALGSGSVGSVWLARDLASGRSVVLKRVPAVPAAERFRRDLALAQGLDHLHVARLLEVRQVEREWVLVSEYGAAGTLASLLRRRGPLSLGELVTLVSPVAQALAAAHRAGLTHSHLGLGDVVLTADGRPLLTDLGLRSLTGERDVAADLAALASLAVSAGGDPRVFSADLFSADASTVAQRVLALANPEPIDLTLTPDGSPSQDNRGGYPSPDGGRTRTRVLNRRFVRRKARSAGRLPVRLPVPGVLSSVALAIVIVLVIGALVITRLDHQPTAVDPPLSPAPSPHPSATLRSAGVPAGSPSEPICSATVGRSPSVDPPPVVPTQPRAGAVRTPGSPVSPVPAAPRSPPRDAASAWRATLRALDVRRSNAFATVDSRVLDTVYVPSSGPWRSDRSILASYRTRGLRVLDLGIRIDHVAVVRTGRCRVVLHVVDRLLNGTIVDASGHHTPLPPAPATTRLITLTRTASTTPWRITQISTA